MIVEITHRPVIVAASLCSVFLYAWIVFIGTKNPPGDRRVSNVALSNSGRFLGAGTAHGEITVWDQAHPDGPKQITFPHGSLNDVHFIRMSMCLRSAPKTWAYIAGHWPRLWDA